jgi:hypothetical protein
MQFTFGRHLTPGITVAHERMKDLLIARPFDARRQVAAKM